MILDYSAIVSLKNQVNFIAEIPLFFVPSRYAKKKLPTFVA
jgi:hypothetical protein